MTEVVIVAVVALVLQAATAVAFLRVSRARAREYARERTHWDAERRDLVDRLMHMADRTWTPPPQLDYGDDDTVMPESMHPESLLPTVPAGY